MKEEKKLRVLIACEESQTVCKAFRELGHEAYSCDIITGSGGHIEWHLEIDARIAYERNAYLVVGGSGMIIEFDGPKWDLVIAFPPCTDLAVSGARWFKNKDQKPAIDFFMWFTRLDCKWAIENPIGIMSTIYRKPDQIIQPWQFGHGETKATCLWLNGLPKLQPTNIVEGREQRIWKLPPSKDRAKLRSKTYPGIAKAMAEQWSNL